MLFNGNQSAHRKTKSLFLTAAILLLCALLASCAPGASSPPPAVQTETAVHAAPSAFAAEPSASPAQSTPATLCAAPETAAPAPAATAAAESPAAAAEPAATPTPEPTLKPTPKPAPKPTPRPTAKSAPKKTAALLRTAALTAGPATVNAQSSSPEPAATASTSGSQKSLESQMISLVNGEREKAGLKALAYDSGLRAGALKHSRDMSDNHFFDHTSPTYGSFPKRISASGVGYSTAGENIAMYGSVSAAHEALMNSSGHRANILGADFTRIGIGIVYNSERKVYYITQWFAG